ncbi:MAG TPA: hypothetical protein VF950_15445 [Planctomycetota bacterium]
MSRPSKVAVCALLACASVFVACPLYVEEIQAGPGKVRTTIWSGGPQTAPDRGEVVVLPQFWIAPVFLVIAGGLAAAGRPVLSLASLGAGLGIFLTLAFAGRSMLRSATDLGFWTPAQVSAGPAWGLWLAILATAGAQVVILWSLRSDEPSRGRP